MPGSMQTVRRAVFMVDAALVGVVIGFVAADTRDARTTGAVGVMGLLLLGHLHARIGQEN